MFYPDQTKNNVLERILINRILKIVPSQHINNYRERVKYVFVSS